MKMQDEEASGEDITLKDKSVQSGKTIEEVEKTSINIHHSNRAKGNKENQDDRIVPTELSDETNDILKIARRRKDAVGIKTNACNSR